MAKYDFGAGFGGAGSGALSGAAIGSAVPGIGTAVGAGVGALTGLFGGFKKKPKRKSTFDPRQKELYQQYSDALQGKGPFADIFNFDANAANQNFENMFSRPAYRSFQENIIPGITGSFRQNNLQNSSYAGEALGRAGRDVQESLDAQRANLIYQGTQDAQNRKFQAIDRILGMNTFDYQKPQGGPIDSILNTLAPIGGDYLANYLRSKGSTGGM